MTITVECPNCGDAVDFPSAPMTTLPEEAVNAAHEAYDRVAAINPRLSYSTRVAVKAALTAALPFLPVQRAVSNAKIEAARKAVEELAYTPMNLPLEDWSRISSAILSALEPSAARELALKEAARVAGNFLMLKTGLHVDKIVELEAAIRALSSPDHADAGKVEGDGWLPMTHPSLPKKGRFLAVATGEIERIAWNDPAVVVTVKAFDGPFVCYVHEDGPGFTDEFGEVYRADGVVIDAEDLTAADDVLRLTRWRPPPSAPASEGAE